MTDAGSAVDYAHELISSRRVEGTPVYSPEGQKLGSVHSVMIEKRPARSPMRCSCSAASSACARTSIRSLGTC